MNRRRFNIACVRCGIIRRWCRKRGCHRRHCGCPGEECPRAKTSVLGDDVLVKPAPVPWWKPIVHTRKRGSKLLRPMQAGKLAHRITMRKNAATIHREGTAHQWTSETARKAVLKRWKHTRRRASTGKYIVPLTRTPKRARYRPDEILTTDGTWRAVDTK
jgi:hypothetical protein